VCGVCMWCVCVWCVCVCGAVRSKLEPEWVFKYIIIYNKHLKIIVI